LDVMRKILCMFGLFCQIIHSNGEIGKLVDWEIGRLVNWEIGKLVNWGIGILVRAVLAGSWGWTI
jgi:hypothetical protein